MSSTTIAGASISRADLLARAKNDPKPLSLTRELNEFYLDHIDQYQGATVGDIIDTADQAASASHRKATTGFRIACAGPVVAIGGLALGVAMRSPLVALGGELAGLAVELAGIDLIVPALMKPVTDHFMSRTTARWGALMAAEQARPQPPAPAPAQPSVPAT